MQYETRGRDYVLAFSGASQSQCSEQNASTEAAEEFNGVSLNLTPMGSNVFHPSGIPTNLQNEQHLPNINEFPIHPDITRPPRKGS